MFLTLVEIHVLELLNLASMFLLRLFRTVDVLLQLFSMCLLQQLSLVLVVFTLIGILILVLLHLASMFLLQFFSAVVVLLQFFSMSLLQ